jgi:hypothetical protein
MQKVDADNFRERALSLFFMTLTERSRGEHICNEQPDFNLICFQIFRIKSKKLLMILGQAEKLGA